MVEFGFAGKILIVDLTSRRTRYLSTADYAPRFIGGKGLAAKLYWDLVPSRTDAFAPENPLICTSGPATGFPKLASSRWLACAKTAAHTPEAFSHGNLGGSWGVRLKYAGYDALVITGKADKPTRLFIHDDGVEFQDAGQLWGKLAIDTREQITAEMDQKVSVLTIGPAGENKVVFATLQADQGASGSSGMGSIMGSKNLKAVVVAGRKKPVAARPQELSELGDHFRRLTKVEMPPFWWIIPGLTKPDFCLQCGIGCSRQVYRDEQGRLFKSFCQPIDIYRRPANKYHDGPNDAVLLAIRLCDQYGLDSSVMQAMIEWLIGCYKEKILNDKNTGLPLSKVGSAEFIEQLTHMISTREGFGDLLARGTIAAAENVGGGAEALVSYSVMNASNDAKDYDPRLILHNALLIATEPRRPVQQIHEASGLLIDWMSGVQNSGGPAVSFDVMREVAKTFWGGAAAADYTSYQGKALASKMIQDRTYFNESMVFCNALGRWPMIQSANSPGGVGEPDLASRILSAITGWEIDAEQLNAMGERIFNMQRAILLRQGWGGRQGDQLLDFYHQEPIQYVRFNRQCIVPDGSGNVASRQGQVIEKDAFEEMKNEYYRHRGWDEETGFQTRTKMSALLLDDVAEDLAHEGLLK